MSFSLLPSLYPDLVDQQSNLAALDNSTADFAVSAATLLGGYYAAHKLENRDVMLGISAAVPLVNAGLAPEGMGSAAGAGTLLFEAVGGTIAHFARRDFLAGATASAVASLLYRLYIASRTA